MSGNSGKASKLLLHIDSRIRVTVQDSRQLVGTFMAFDKHMNLVLGDCSEFRRAKGKKNEAGVVEERMDRRKLGLVILRGENIVSITVDGPGPQVGNKRKAPGGPGIAAGVGRGAMVQQPPGMGMAPPMGAPMGLGAAPAFGVGGVGGGQFMQPNGAGRGRGM